MNSNDKCRLGSGKVWQWCILGAVSLAAVLAPQWADAQTTERIIVFPYANMQNMTGFAGGMGFGGGINTDCFKQLITTTADNVIWNAERTYYTANDPDSWFSGRNYLRYYQIVIRNTGDVSLTGAEAVRIYVYEDAGGAPADETTTWNGGGLLINQSPLASGSWNSAGDYFAIDVYAGQSVVLNAWIPNPGDPDTGRKYWGAYRDDHLYTTPSPGRGKHTHLELIQPSGHMFEAQIRGWVEQNFRTSSGNDPNDFSDEKVIADFSYDGICVTDYPEYPPEATNPRYCLTLPSFFSRFNGNDRDVDEWTTHIIVHNTASVTDNLTISYFTQDGLFVRSVDSTQNPRLTLAPHERLRIIPSQLLLESDLVELPSGGYIGTGSVSGTGYITIEGDPTVEGSRPAAVAMNRHFVKTDHAIGKIVDGRIWVHYTRTPAYSATSFLVSATEDVSCGTAPPRRDASAMPSSANALVPLVPVGLALCAWFLARRRRLLARKPRHSRG